MQSPLETYLREINETALLTAAEEKMLAYRIGDGDNDAEVNKFRFGSAKEGAKQIADKIAKRNNEELIEDAMAVGGDADTVCRQVEKWAEAGIDQFIFMLQAGDTTHDQVMRSIDIIGDQVIPRFPD